MGFDEKAPPYSESDHPRPNPAGKFLAEKKLEEPMVPPAGHRSICF